MKLMLKRFIANKKKDRLKNIVAILSIFFIGFVTQANAAKSLGEIFLEELGKELLKPQQQGTQSGQPQQTNPRNIPQQVQTQQSVLGEYKNPYKGPIFPDGIATYEGQSRFEEEILRGDLYSTLTFSEDEYSYPLTESQSNKVSVSSSAAIFDLNTMWPTLHCTYRSTSKRDIFRGATFWYKARPEIYTPGYDEAKRVSFIKSSIENSLTNDVAVESCPATWGDAMSVLWGIDAWSRKQTMYANAREKSKQQEVEYMNTQKATFETKIKTNATPTTGDIITVAIENSMKKTYDETKFKSQKNSESYWVYKDFNGDRIYAAEIFINIRNLSCNKQKGKHVCNYDEVSQSSPIVNGKAITMASPIESHNRTTTFYWTQSGLKTDNIKVVYLEKAVESQKKGYVNSIECGRWNDLHPYDKKDCFRTFVPMPREDFEKL